MYYILSAVDLKELQIYEMPLKDKYGNRDSQIFFNSKQGEQFLNIDPLRIAREKDKESTIGSLIMDLKWVSLCYNCPLYMYICSDKWFYKYLKLQVHRYTNFYKVHKMQECGIGSDEKDNYRLPPLNRVYSGDMDKLENDIRTILKDVNMVKTPILGYKITLNAGFIQI